MKKVPISPGTLRPAAANNPNDWDTFENALESYARNKRKGVGGIGFVFTKEDPYCGIDLDDCRNPETGEIIPFAQEIIEKLGSSYTEVSVSGKGIHIICRARLSSGGRVNSTCGIEVYDRDRYFIMTGNILDGRSQIHKRQREVDEILASYFNQQGRTRERLPGPGEPLSGTEGENRSGTREISQGGVGHGKLDEYIRDLNISPEKKRLILEGESQGQRSEAIMGVVDSLVHAGVSDEIIFGIFEKYPIGEKYREKGAARQRWLRGRIEKAKGFLKTAPPDGTSEAPKTFTAADLEKEDVSHPDWIIEGLLPPGLTLLAGAPKAGKTRLVTGIAIGKCTGGKILGSIESEQCEVFIMCLEDAKWRIKERLLAAFGAAPFPAGLHLATDWHTVAEGGMDQLDQWLQEHPQVKLVIIDVLRRFDRASLSRNVYQAEYDSIIKIKALADKFGIAIIVLHHTNKVRDSSDIFDRVSGTTGLTGACDTVWVLERQNRAGMDGKLHVAGRDVEGQELALRFDRGSGTWTLLGDAARFSAPKKQQDVLQYLESQEGPRAASTGLPQPLDGQITAL